MRGQASALEPLRTSRRGHQQRTTRVSLARIVQQRRAHEPAHGPLESGARHHTIGNYANLLRLQGTTEALAEAKLLYKEAIEGLTSHHSRSHPVTLFSVGGYADATFMPKTITLPRQARDNHRKS